VDRLQNVRLLNDFNIHDMKMKKHMFFVFSCPFRWVGALE
jgi:hypothetical protein